MPDVLYLNFLEEGTKNFELILKKRTDTLKEKIVTAVCYWV